ncbi:hypothetical protein [Streptomyces spinosirectus]
MTETPVGRGRHRRPRPRKVLFAVGGLALAAGALSLARMAPESGVGGIGTAEADPRQDPGPGAARSGNAATTVEEVPRVSRSAASVLGGVSVTPTAGASVLPLPATTTPPAHSTAAAAPGTTTVPEAPNAPTATATGRPPATTAPAPRPSPTPGRTTPPPAPAPSHTHGPGLCVPVVGLCVGALSDKHG